MTNLMTHLMTHLMKMKVTMTKNFTDSSLKLKETGLTICLKMKNKMMDYSTNTLSNHSNILVELMIKIKLVMKIMT